jgi:hypothetical protein
LIGGMLNGNVAVMQTMLAEMIKNPKHERELHCKDSLAKHWLIWLGSHCLRNPSFRVVRWRHPRVRYGRLPR